MKKIGAQVTIAIDGTRRVWKKHRRAARRRKTRTSLS